MRSITRPLATAGATLLLVLALAACGDDDGGADGDSSDSASATESSPTAEETDESTPTDEGSPTEDATDPSTGASSRPKDASEEDFCEGLKDVADTVMGLEGIPTESEWKAIQKSYADLGEIGAPDGTRARQREGFEVVVDAITRISYAEAKAQFGDSGDGTIPGVSEEDNTKANEFFAYASSLCADVLQ